jgi:peptide/nickel transport system permease protein
MHQYWQYLGHVAQLNFGTDLMDFPAKVSTILGEALPWTIVLVGTATVIAFFVGTGLGILAGWRGGGWLDRALPTLTFVQSLPYFFLALILLYVLSVKFTIFPEGGGYNYTTVHPGWYFPFIWNAIGHSILPAFTIVITNVAGWMLQMRNVMITTTGEDYVLAAQAKGLKSGRVVLTYAARNAILPQLSGFANALGFVVGGAIIMEYVFNYPGIGVDLVNAVSSNDYPLMQAIFLFITFAVLLANLFVDIVYVLADPRARTRRAR